MNTLDVSTVQKAYSRWAGVYDLIFGRVFNRARRRAIGLMQLGSGARVLEVGVGTGLSLSFFPESCWVAGVDLSRPMLQQAASRIGREELGSRVLIEGDGARLPFANGVFDAALAPFVVSAAP
ncbi:MAG: class I SAM-dependent methyltransferase, partial [Acidobacteriota bacterium]